MEKVIKSLLFAVAFAAIRCTSTPAPQPPSPISPDAGNDAGDLDAKRSSDCAKACLVLTGYNCPESRSTPGGGTCTGVCQNAKDSGVLALNTRCVISAKSQSALRACGVECAP